MKQTFWTCDKAKDFLWGVYLFGDLKTYVWSKYLSTHPTQPIQPVSASFLRVLNFKDLEWDLPKYCKDACKKCKK